MHKTYNKNTVEKIKEIPEMESRINKLANITGNGPQRPSETTWSLPIMMLRNWKNVSNSIIHEHECSILHVFIS